MSLLKIEKPKLVDGELTSRLSVSGDLEKYIMNPELIVKYENKIYTDESILNIPLTATILPLAWLTGANVQVESIDKRLIFGNTEFEFEKTNIINVKARPYIKVNTPDYNYKIDTKKALNEEVDFSPIFEPETEKEEEEFVEEDEEEKFNFVPLIVIAVLIVWLIVLIWIASFISRR